MLFCKQTFIELLKFIFIISIAHLYIYTCAVAYSKLEVYPQPNEETVNSFLINLKNGQYEKETESSMLEKYKTLKQQEQRQIERVWFQNFPKTFVYVLAAHTTLGNRHMNVKTKNAQLFYFFTVPLGVLLYYLMIHFVATRLDRILKDACMLVWRCEDDPMSDRERDIFERLKLLLVTFTFTIILIACLAAISLMESRPYITELIYIIDVIYTISSSENFVLFDLDHDGYNAALCVFVYFILILAAYSTSYALITIFTHHSARHVFGFIFGEWAYRCFSADDDNENKKSVWDDYESVPMADSRKGSGRSDVSVQSTSWLHNDGNFGLKNFGGASNETSGRIAENEERYVDTP